MEFELMTWGDGVVHLFHEDSLHGHDVVVALEEDGAYRCHHDRLDDSMREKVDLAEFLRALAKERGV